MRVVSFLLTSSAVLALAMADGGLKHPTLAQTEAPGGTEAGSASLDQLRLRVDEAR